jgi:hypothetical protein
MTAVYGASHIKRLRATASDMTDRRERLLDIVAAQRPMTVRQVFYQATVEGVVEKTEAGYSKVQIALAKMRRDGVMPFGWIVDNTRMQRRPRTYGSVAEALENTAQLYRKSLWRDAEDYVEVWLEKDALSGVIYPITQLYDVPLMVARGYSSLSFLHSAAEQISYIDKPTYIYHLGDYDPSGVNAGEKIEQTLRELAPDADIHFERLAVNPIQIKSWSLPSRPTKSSDSRAKNFDSKISVELDAIQPDMLRRIVENAINRHLPQDQLEVLKTAEKNERDFFLQIVEELTAGGVA